MSFISVVVKQQLMIQKEIDHYCLQSEQQCEEPSCFWTNKDQSHSQTSAPLLSTDWFFTGISTLSTSFSDQRLNRNSFRSQMTLMRPGLWVISNILLLFADIANAFGIFSSLHGSFPPNEETINQSEWMKWNKMAVKSEYHAKIVLLFLRKLSVHFFQTEP